MVRSARGEGGVMSELAKALGIQRTEPKGPRKGNGQGEPGGENVVGRRGKKGMGDSAWIGSRVLAEEGLPR